MARELRWWLAATLVTCGIITVAYVPPRGVAPETRSRDRRPQPTAARLRAQAIADQWRGATLALRLAQYRQRLEPELVRLRETDRPGPALHLDAPDTIPEYARVLVRAALDTVWHELRLGVSKVAVGVVVDFWRSGPTGTGATPKATRGGGYLLPDSTDRATCVALIPAWYWGRMLVANGPPARSRQVEDWLRGGLGQCAFVAAYGVPGNAVRRWLAKRHYDLARVPSWDRPWSARPEDVWVTQRIRQGWWWDGVYRLPVATIACLAGRAGSCRAAVLAGADDSANDSLPRLFAWSDRFWWRNERLVDGGHYLSDVAREVGHDRFLRFWNSTEPVDTALAAALKTPVGEWTASWQRRRVPRLPLGAAAPLPAAAFGILLAGAAVIGVALGAARRQVG
jgi:hypothetical protein